MTNLKFETLHEQSADLKARAEKELENHKDSPVFYLMVHGFVLGYQAAALDRIKQEFSEKEGSTWHL